MPMATGHPRKGSCATGRLPLKEWFAIGPDGRWQRQAILQEIDSTSKQLGSQSLASMLGPRHPVGSRLETVSPAMCLQRDTAQRRAWHAYLRDLMTCEGSQRNGSAFGPSPGLELIRLGGFKQDRVLSGLVNLTVSAGSTVKRVSARLRVLDEHV